MSDIDDTIGILLAGGLGRRMGGGEKSLKTIGGRLILDWVIERSKPQVANLMLNANGNLEQFRRFGLPVVSDVVGGFAGPLAGILTGLEWTLARYNNVRWVASFATDAPFIPTDMVKMLKKAILDSRSDIAYASSSNQVHPVFALWPTSIAGELRHALVDEGIRKIDQFTANYLTCKVDFAIDPIDPFFNVNNPENLVEAESLYRLL